MVNSVEGPTIVAVGGNSLTRAHQVGTIAEQRVNAAATCDALIELVMSGHQLVLTHGNGPQVGNVLRRVELAAESVYTLPLDICDGDTQGGIGYMLQQILGDKLEAKGLKRRVATIVTQVIVDSDDVAFSNPQKPIGPFMSEDEAKAKEKDRGWDIARVDSRGFRRVVASPSPKKIVEMHAINAVIDSGVICICVGGGGVPVCLKDGQLLGLEAVIDKDRASSLLATKLGAPLFVITTSVPQVLLDYEKPTERPIAEMTLEEAKKHLADGQFAPGSMGPKIESVIDFLENGGKAALITDPQNLGEAIKGNGGTWIRADHG